MTLPADLRGTASLDITPFRKGTRDALAALREVTDFAKKNGTLILTTKLAGLTSSAIQAQIRAATSGAPLPITITLNPASVTAAVAALRTALSSVIGINLSALSAVQVQINTQITGLTALIAQLRALGGGGGGGGGRAGSGLSGPTQDLLSRLEATNNAFKRGELNASDYAARLGTLQATLRTAAAAATLGTTEFKAIDAALSRVTQGLRSIESSKITQLRTELAGARQQFDAAAAAATNLAQKRAAIAAYEGDLVRIRTALNGMAASGQLTAQQLGNVNRLLGQTARESNTIRGGINLGGLSGNIQNALQNLTAFVPGLAQMSSIFGALPVPILASAAAIAVFSAGLAASFKTAAQFQQVMADIRALTQPTAEGFEQLKAAALNLGAPLGVGAREAGAAILELNRAGLSAADAINGGLVGALTLAGAAGISAAEGGKLATAAMTAFGLAAEDMPRIADVFANFANQTFLGAQDLSQAIAAVGPVAQSAGLELDQFSGYMAVLAKGGFKRMTDAGTSLKVMLLSLMSPAATAAKQMEKLGFSSYDAAGNLRPFTDTLDDLRERLKGMSEQGQNRVLRDLFGTDGIRAATILLKQSREEVDAVIASQGKLGEAARVAGDRLDSYNGAVAKLGASWETFRITIGEKLLPVMTDLVDSLKVGVDTLQSFANGTESIVPYIAPIIGAFIALRGAAIAAAAPAIWASLIAAISGFFTTITVFVASNPLGALALAVSALAVVINKLYADTARIYADMDESNAASSAALTKRAAELRAEGTELGKVQAKYLEALDRVSKAEQGRLTGTNFFGERNYVQDAAELAAARKEAAALRDEGVQLRTELERHGKIKATLGGPGLAPGQLEKREEALKSLREALNEKAFTLKVEGMTELDAALAKTGSEFDALRIKVKAAFAGNLNNSELLSGLAELDKGRAAQEAAIRQKFTDQASKSATDSARQVQRAELEAMVEGQAKKNGLRELEIADIQAQAQAKIDALAGFPEQQGKIESDARRIAAAKRQGWRQEDLQLTQDNAKRVLDVERQARDGAIAAMEDGRAKREAVRDAELEDLRASIAEKVRELSGDPEAQRGAQAAGNKQIAAKQQQQNRERIQEAKETAQLVVDAEASARDGTIAAMEDGLAKREAIRAKDLEALRKSISERVKALEGDPEAQKDVRASGQNEINSKLREQAQQRVKEEQTAQDQVLTARKSARAAAVALIEDEAQQRRAAREDEVAALQETLKQRLEAVKGYPQKQKEIQELARQEARNLEKKWAAEDTLEATARAQRIADAYLKAQDAQIKAEQAGRDNQAAQYELDLSRRLAGVKDNAVASAQIEAEGQRERARLAEVSAQIQLSQDQNRLAITRDRELSNTKLSADERTAIWRTYYADLNTLSTGFQAGEKERLAQQERDARAATEAVREAYIQTANKPIERSESRTQELQQSRDLAETDSEILAINQRIAAERELQVQALGFQLIGLDGVRLTTEERAAVEEKIRGLQREQTVALRDQEASGQALRQSTLARLENEAEYAEKVAKTTKQLEAARAAQLAVARARLMELDDQIAAEGREVQRNALLDQRYALMGKIADLTQREANAPIEADERKLKLYQAQAEIKLIASGLGNDEAATAQLTLQIAGQQLLLANRRVAVASTLIELEAAQNDQAQVRLALAQAYAATLTRAALTPLTPPSITAFEDPLKKQAEKRQQAITRERELRQQGLDDLGRELDLQNRLQDVSEARTRALAQITRVGDDAVASAALELSLTRERLSLTDSQLRMGDLGAAGRAALLQKRVDLLTKEEAQQRQLNETRRASARLTEEVTLAESRLTEALAGTSAESNGVTVASRQIVESRRALTVAEREYAQARRDADQVGSIANLEKLKTATDAVAGAVGAQRAAIRNLAGEYRTLIGQMDGVRDAGEKLRQVAYGDATPFQADRERDRLSAITARRDAAQIELARALEGGKPELIARAAEELTKQQERYNAQLELLSKNGVKADQTGKKETQRLADAVDSLGIQYDREAVALAERARITDQEAENVLKLQVVAQMFDTSTTTLATSLETATVDLANALKQDKRERDSQTQVDREIANVNREIADKTAKIVAAPPVPTLPPRTLPPQTFNLFGLTLNQFLDQLAARTAPPESQPKSEPKSEPATNAGLRNLLKFLKEKAEAEEALNKQMSARLRAATIREAAEQRAQERQKTPATSPINNYAGDIYYMTVNALPGQSAEAIADMAIRKLENRARRSGKGCPS